MARETAAHSTGLVPMSCLDLLALVAWPGVRRAGVPNAEPGADAGPAAPLAAPP